MFSFLMYPPWRRIGLIHPPPLLFLFILLVPSFIPVLSFPFQAPISCLFFFFWWRSPLFLNGTSLLRAYRVSKLRLPLQSCSFKQPIHTKRQLAALMKTSLKLQELQAWDAFIRSMENAFPSCQFL